MPIVPPNTEPDNRSAETRVLHRIAAARAHLPAVDHNGTPVNGAPRYRYNYGPGGILESVEPDDAPNP